LEKERSRNFLYLPSHDKSFEKKNIEKDEIEKNEIEKKINVKMNQIKKEIIHFEYAIKMMK
jgi:hypothetical protein